MKNIQTQIITVLALGGLLLGGTLTQAQEAKGERKGRPEGRGGPGGGSQRLLEGLNLTDEQKPKVEAIMKEQGEKMRALFQDQSGSREERGTKMRELGEATNAKLKEVLTKEQMEKYAKARSEAMSRFGGGPGGPGAPGGPGGGRPGGNPAERLESMAKELNLTDEQKGKIKTIMEEEGKKLAALREDQNTPREERFAKFREATDAMNAKIKPILNAEQQEKWAKMQENRFGGRSGGDGAPRRRPNPDNK